MTSTIAIQTKSKTQVELFKHISLNKTVTIKELCMKFSRTNTYYTLNQLRAIQNRLKIKIFERIAFTSEITGLPMFKLKFLVDIEVEDKLGLIIIKKN